MTQSQIVYDTLLKKYKISTTNSSNKQQRCFILNLSKLIPHINEIYDTPESLNRLFNNIK